MKNSDMSPSLFESRTYSYYSRWLGKEDILNEDFQGIRYIYSAERNKTQAGYSKPFDLYLFCQPGRIAVSYGDKLVDRVDALKARIDRVVETGDLCSQPQKLTQELAEIFGVSPAHSVKFVFGRPADSDTKSRLLGKSDYGDYLDFFLANNPGCKDTGWIREYFEEMADAGFCYGYYADGMLVSCTDAPDMPYMADAVRELGINTRLAYRGRGYGADACAACIKHMLQRDICPLWSAAADNMASQRLAVKAGFARLADVLALAL